MLSDLITSKTRVKLLNIFLAQPNEMLHVRECVRRAGEEINAVRRELLFLEKKGVFQKEPRANRIYYSLSKEYPFYYDLPGLSVLVGGMWINNLNYWGCNQYIIQRALGADLKTARSGILFAAFTAE